MTNDFTLYDTLGVDPSADTATIKKAYRNASFANHPDAADQSDKFASGRFRAINHAYAILVDTRTRTEYDRSISHTKPVPTAGVATSSSSPAPTTRTRARLWRISIPITVGYLIAAVRFWSLPRGSWNEAVFSQAWTLVAAIIFVSLSVFWKSYSTETKALWSLTTYSWRQKSAHRIALTGVAFVFELTILSMLLFLPVTYITFIMTALFLGKITVRFVDKPSWMWL